MSEAQQKNIFCKWKVKSLFIFDEFFRFSDAELTAGLKEKNSFRSGARKKYCSLSGSRVKTNRALFNS
jgi:hypothetical protein